jgi:hypothetical protein
MIKIILSNRINMETSHLNGLEKIVRSKIEGQKKGANKDLLQFLIYLESKVKTILCGEKRDLEKIIEEIEQNYFIAPSKLSKILKYRERKKDKSELMNYLQTYAKEKNLINYLSLDAYKKVINFKTEVDNLSKVKWLGWKEILEDIFDYESFTKEKISWNAYDLVSAININVCPYCNRNYITTLINGDKRTRAVLDHYYAKSLYPYLALSLYNLIPCCYVCNSSFKGDKDFYKNEAIYPYEEDFSNAALFKTDFSDTEPYDYKYLLGLSKEFKLKINIVTSDDVLKNKIENSISTFKLENLYDSHRDYVRDLIRNAIVNNKSRIEEIYKLFSGDLFKSKNEVMQSMYLTYIDNENVGKRSLAKLAQDILKEIDVL